MAATQTTRLDIYRWSSGSDIFTRAQMTDSHDALESKVVGFEHGTSRPVAAAEYLAFFYYHTTTGHLSYCVEDGLGGYEWLDFLGGTTPESVSTVASAGTAQEFARIDHVHDVATDAIATANIIDLNVTSGKLASGSVIAGKIGVGGISNSNQFAAGVVDTAAMANDSVTDDILDSITGINANLVTSKTGSTIPQAAVPSGIPSAKVDGLVESLDDLSDVTIAGPSTGEAVVYTGAGWENSSISPAVDDLTDATITGTPADNEVFAWDTGTAEWINQTAAEANLAVADHAHTHAHSVPIPMVFNKDGTLSAAPGGTRFYVPFLATINSVKAAVNGAPTGSSIILDVNINGVSIFTTQSNRPTIADGGNVSTVYMPDTTSVAADQFITVDIDQVGSTSPGTDLTVIIELTRAISGGGAEPHSHLGADDHLFPFSIVNTVSVETGALRYYMPFAATIAGCRASAGTAPVGADLIVDVNIDGTTAFTTQGNRPTITDGSNDSGSWAVPDVTAVSAGEYLTVDVDQVGSGTAGADLVVMVHLTSNIS
jgi:hypothetical protein